MSASKSGVRRVLPFNIPYSVVVCLNEASSQKPSKYQIPGASHASSSNSMPLVSVWMPLVQLKAVSEGSLLAY